MMNRRDLGRVAAGLMATTACAGPLCALAADEAPDAMVRRLSNEILGVIKSDASIKKGDLVAVIALVNQKVMPSVNFRRMTAAAVGTANRLK